MSSENASGRVYFVRVGREVVAFQPGEGRDGSCPSAAIAFEDLRFALAPAILSWLNPVPATPAIVRQTVPVLSPSDPDLPRILDGGPAAVPAETVRDAVEAAGNEVLTSEEPRWSVAKHREVVARLAGRVVAEVDRRGWLAETAWRRWAVDLLREPDDRSPDDLLMRKISSVVSAPAVIEAGEDPALCGVALSALAEAARECDMHNHDYGHHVTPSGKIAYWLRLSGAAPRPAVVDAIEAMARFSVEVCRAVAPELSIQVTGDSWEEADPDARRDAIREVEDVLRGERPEEIHERWRRGREAAGWRFGAWFDRVLKTHPAMVPYDQLPPEVRALDRVVTAAVLAARDIPAYPMSWARCHVSLRLLNPGAGKAEPIRVNGNLTPEQFAEFRRRWENEVAAGQSRMVIRDADEPRAMNPVGVLSFIDATIDTMLSRPGSWGSLLEVELQVVLLLEVRAYLLAGAPAKEAVMRELVSVSGKVLGDAGVPHLPLSVQLTELGRADEFPVVMGQLVSSQRAQLRAWEELAVGVRAATGGEAAP